MTVRYEWDVETVDEHDDIIDHFFQKDYAGVLEELAKDDCPGLIKRAVLVRDDDKGRSWAYLEDGELPEYFENAYGEEAAKVPAKFIREVAG